MLKISFFYTNREQRRLRHSSTASLMTLCSKPCQTSDIDQALLQFIDVINLVDLLLHFPIFYIQVSADLCQRSDEMNAGVCHSGRLIVSVISSRSIALLAGR